MIEQLKDSDKIQVQNFGLAEWLKDAQEAIQAGYEFDFETNEGYPQQIGHVYTCQMLPVKQKQVEQVVTELEPMVITPWVGSESVPSDLCVTLEETTSEPVFSPPTELVTELPPVVSEQKIAEVNQPAKRGPKPKQQ